jgi:hypothetical protein
MGKNFNLLHYIFQLILGILCSFFGYMLLRIPQNTWLIINPSFKSIQTLANHRIAGIFLAFIGFILLYYLIFITANILLTHWSNLKWALRVFTTLWIFLLFIATLYHSITLYHILGYIFIFSIIIFSFFLILNYFKYKP